MHSVLLKGLVVILSSPSGGGKTSLKNGLLKLCSNYKSSISVTTRLRRPAELEGNDYYFKSRQDFEKLILEDQFIEYAEIYGNLYGTLRSSFEKIINDKFDLLLNLDWQGAKNLKEKTPNAISIFISPPSLKILKERLIARNQDSNKSIEKRLASAETEIKYAKDYDYVVINDTFDKTLKEINKIIINNKKQTI